MRPPGPKELGKISEEKGAVFFLEKGYTILEKNYRNRYGEIDLILEDQGCIVFVEVKARSSSRYGLPQEAVSPHKQRQILRVAQGFLQQRGLLDAQVRFDVLSMTWSTGAEPDIEHIPWAFGCG